MCEKYSHNSATNLVFHCAEYAVKKQTPEPNMSRSSIRHAQSCGRLMLIKRDMSDMQGGIKPRRKDATNRCHLFAPVSCSEEVGIAKRHIIVRDRLIIESTKRGRVELTGITLPRANRYRDLSTWTKLNRRDTTRSMSSSVSLQPEDQLALLR